MTDPSPLSGAVPRLRALEKRIRPKREYCNVNGESYCRDRDYADEHCCSSCLRRRWADELSAILEGITREQTNDDQARHPLQSTSGPTGSSRSQPEGDQQ